MDYRYEFKITIGGYGDTLAEAWHDACEGFSLDPGELPSEDEYTKEEA